MVVNAGRPRGLSTATETVANSAIDKKSAQRAKTDDKRAGRSQAMTRRHDRDLRGERTLRAKCKHDALIRKQREKAKRDAKRRRAASRRNAAPPSPYHRSVRRETRFTDIRNDRR